MPMNMDRVLRAPLLTLLMIGSLHPALAVDEGSAQIHDAASRLGDYFSFNGFGTLGAVQTDSDDEQFVRDRQVSGATQNTEFEVDSNMGAQLTARANNWLSGTVQLLAMQRDKEDNIDVEVEWAFAKLKPVKGLTIRAGRMALPTFAISDFRNVGYANTWIRPPDEVYGLALLHRLQGADVTYSLPIGSTTLSLSAMGGKSFLIVTGGTHADVDDVKGANLVWETPWVTLRFGRIEGDVHIAGMIDPYTFSGVGATVDRDGIVMQAEYVTRRSELVPDVVDADGWYVLGGYRFDSVLPYVSYADTAPKNKASPFHVSGEQSTIAVGVRWDAWKSAAIKFQLQRAETHGTSGISFVTDPIFLGPGLPPGSTPVRSPVVAASLAVDFVF